MARSVASPLVSELEDPGRSHLVAHHGAAGDSTAGAFVDDDAVALRELVELAAEDDVLVGDDAVDDVDARRAAEHLRSRVPDLADRDVYVCGPPAMVRALRVGLHAAAVPRRNLYVEEFALAA